MQSIIYDANRRGILNEVSLGQCEQKRKIAEEKLNNLRAKLAVLLQKLQLVSDEIVCEQKQCTLWKDPVARSPPNIVTCYWP
jgi:hypothetical protein